MSRRAVRCAVVTPCGSREQFWTARPSKQPRPFSKHTIVSSECGTRNDAAIFKQLMKELNARVATGNSGEIVRAAISAFDSIVGQYVKELRRFIPLTRRRAGLLERNFHDLDATAGALKECFDLDVLKGIAADRQTDLKRMFHRRHVYEHNGGEADRDYLEKSGDISVRLKQHLSETPDALHQLLSDLERMTRSLQEGFHDLLPPLEAPIKDREELLARRKAAGAGTT